MTVQTDESRLRQAGIRPTRQRLAAMQRIREGGTRHLNAEDFHNELQDCGLSISLATVYNTLNQFAAAGILKRLALPERTFFCTNTAEHHHFYEEDTGRLYDIPGTQPEVVGVPTAPEGARILGIDVVVRVRSAN